MSNNVERPFLDSGLTRLEFLRISGKGLTGLAIAPLCYHYSAVHRKMWIAVPLA